MPVADSIHWKPLRDPHYVIVSLQPGQGGLRQVFVQQAVLLRVQALASFAAKGPLLGLLLGHRWDCPITGARYLLIDSLAEGPPTVPDEDAQSALLGSLLAQRRRDTSVECLGWYAAKRGVVSHMSQMESAVHLARFQTPWQTALIVADGGRAGGFFQRDVLESRWFQAPFFEVTDPKAHAHAKKPTSIDWPEYLTTDLVAPLIRPHAPLLTSPRPSEAARSPRPAPAKSTLAKPALAKPALAKPALAKPSPAKRGRSRIEAAKQHFGTASTRALGAVRAGVRRGAAAAASAYRWTVAHVVFPVVSTGRQSVEALRNAAERARTAQEPMPELATATPVISAPAAVTISPSSAPVRSPSASPVYRPTIPAAKPAIAPAVERPTAPAVERPTARPVRRSQPTPAILADVEDTAPGDTPYRYLALARREGFQVGAKLERGTPERPETLWLLIEPASGLRLTLVTSDEGVREASLHCNLRTDDEALLRATPAEYRDIESRTIYVREACLVSLRARCRRLRATGKLEPDWKVAPSFHPHPVRAQSEQS